MCLGSGAERKRVPWWRTTRAFITTRRAFERSRIETAARRPRPNRERLRPWPERKLEPMCPAFFAARITSPTKVWGALGATVAGPDAARADLNVVVAGGHGRDAGRNRRRRRSEL